MTKTSALAADFVRFESIVDSAKVNYETAIQAASDAITNGYGSAVANAHAEMEKVGEAAFKAADEVAKFGKENVDAVVTASNVVAKAAEDLNKLAFNNAKAGFKAFFANAKAVSSAKSVQEVVDLQTALVESEYKKLVADVNKVSDLSKKAADKAVAPIQARVEATVEKFVNGGRPTIPGNSTDPAPCGSASKSPAT